ncbi:hypothetical protein BY458DRAFT_438941 [Sporodiniella umbellata]|nr:hypothetical protein BY458DRAFT_438941 [Sporodiniella umbellata]
MITLLGLMTILVNIGTLFYFNHDLSECPKWVYTTFGVGLFIYQSLDAIDGKQARRTGTSGPLGELFDHGCDALNTTLGVLTWASATYLGQSWWTVASLTASLATFYLSTWEEYHTGVLYLGRFSGPVEGVLMLCSIHLISGYFGPAIWMLRINEFLPWVDFSHYEWVGYLQLNHGLIVLGAIIMVCNIFAAIWNVATVKIWPTETSHKKTTTFDALLGLSPFVVMCYWSYMWLKTWPDIVSYHLAIFIPFIGLLFGHQVGLMITAHVAKLEFPNLNLPMTLVLMSGYLIAKHEATIEE